MWKLARITPIMYVYVCIIIIVIAYLKIFCTKIMMLVKSIVGYAIHNSLETNKIIESYLRQPLDMHLHLYSLRLSLYFSSKFRLKLQKNNNSNRVSSCFLVDK